MIVSSYTHVWQLLLGAALVLVSFSPFSAVGQYILDEKVSFVYVTGTSTLHDWTATAENMSGTMQAEEEQPRLIRIDSVTISIPATSLKSGKETMDINIQKTLKSNRYPEINFRLEENSIQVSGIMVKGRLTIGGITRTIATTVCQEDAGKYMKINGNVKLRMSDFNLKAPEFMFGAFTTGDEILVKFYFCFSKRPH